MGYELVKVDRTGARAVVTLSRPDQLNAINLRLAAELEAALKDVGRDEGIRVVLLRGEGRGFCQGGDVKDMASAKDPRLFLRDLSSAIHKSVLELRGMPKPVLAGVNGSAVGAGLGLVLASDIAVAREDATLKAGFISAGLTPGCGTFFIPKRLDYHRACQFIFLDETLSAREGMELGLVNFVEPAGSFESRLDDIMTRLENGPTRALAGAKELLNRSYMQSLPAHQDNECALVARSGATGDFREAMTAFAHKRRPVFRGR